MTDPDYTHVTLVIDRSGSMQECRTDAEGGVNGFLAEQRAQPGRLTVTLIQFDTRVETVADFQPVADVPEYHLKPRGMTALMDAVGRSIVATGERLAALPEDQRPGNVLLAIVTDGAENASQEWTMDAVKASIEHQKTTYGWTVVFLGADDAAWQGDRIGATHTVSYRPDSDGTQAAYSGLTRSTTCLRGTGTYTPAPPA